MLMILAQSEQETLGSDNLYHSLRKVKNSMLKPAHAIQNYRPFSQGLPYSPTSIN
jgi:hypothetical protein